MTITSVKYMAYPETPYLNYAYLVNNRLIAPIGIGDELEIEVDIWIALGNIPDDAYTLDELKSMKIGNLDSDLNTNPHVTVPLEDTSTIVIFGSRNDQFDIGDRYELMKEDSIPNIYIRDVDNIIYFLSHLDVKRCYKAITIHRNNSIEYQWTKEAEIMACTTQAELDLITWTMP